MNYLGFAAIGALIASVWSYIRNVFSQLRSYFVVNVKVEGYLSRAMQLLLWREFKRRHIGDRDYEARMFHVRPASQTLLVGFEVIGKSFQVFWKGWKPLCISAIGSKDSNGSPVSSSNDVGQADKLSINFIRGTFDVEELMIQAIDLFNKNLSDQVDSLRGSRYYVKKCLGTRLLKFGNQGQPSPTEVAGNLSSNIDNVLEAGSKILKWGKNDIGEPGNANPFDYLDFPQEVLDHIEDIKRWKNSRDWFKQREIPWRRGFLLHGAPGTGKSSMTRALGQLLDMPIYIYDLSTMTNDDLNREWSYMLNHVPVIAAFEDIDSIFHGRKNIQGEDGITFDCLLNCISGISNSCGVFTIMTTNDISKIDAALGNFSNSENISSRPGRLDKIIELKSMTKVNRLSMAERILSDCPKEIDKLVEQSEGYTPAQFQELCTQIALTNYWKDR